MNLPRKFEIMKSGLFSCPVCSKENGLQRLMTQPNDIFRCFNCRATMQMHESARGRRWHEILKVEEAA